MYKRFFLFSLLGIFLFSFLSCTVSKKSVHNHVMSKPIVTEPLPPSQILISAEVIRQLSEHNYLVRVDTVKSRGSGLLEVLSPGKQIKVYSRKQLKVGQQMILQLQQKEVLGGGIVYDLIKADVKK